MTPSRPPAKQMTFWHPLFVRVLRHALPSAYFDIEPEFLLNQQPLRLDAVVIRKHDLPAALRPSILAPVVTYLGEHTIIELKGSTDAPGWTDLVRLLGCAHLYRVERGLAEPERLCLMMVASQLTDGVRQQAERMKARQEKLGEGVHALAGLGYTMYFIETEAVSDHVLHFFSRSFVKDAGARGRLLNLLSDEERGILTELLGDVQQLRKDELSHVRYADYEDIAMSWEEVAKKILPQMPPELRLWGMTPEERLKGLPPEERLKGLPPEERLKGLPLEERLKGTTPEERELLFELLLSERKKG